MNVITRARFVDRKAPGSMGVVKDTRYVNCLWPVLDEPTTLFAAGSSGLEVQGPPTPRNVIFPPGTKALGNTNLGVFYRAEAVTESVVQPHMVTEKVLIRGEEKEVTYRHVGPVDVTHRKVTAVLPPPEEARPAARRTGR